MQNQSFNIVQLAIAVTLVAVSASLFVACGDSGSAPAKGELSAETLERAKKAGRDTRARFELSMRLRNIHKALITYSDGNRGHYPGLKPNGESDGVTVEERYAVLLEEDFITPETVVSPFETSPPKSGYSFAMLQLPEQGQRRLEWRQTLNSQAVVMSDRNIGTEQSPDGLIDGAEWEFAVLWNDNHVGIQDSDLIQAKYGQAPLGPDKLFTAEGDDDALLIYTGN